MFTVFLNLCNFLLVGHIVGYHATENLYLDFDLFSAPKLDLVQDTFF